MVSLTHRRGRGAEVRVVVDTTTGRGHIVAAVIDVVQVTTGIRWPCGYQLDRVEIIPRVVLDPKGRVIVLHRATFTLVPPPLHRNVVTIGVYTEIKGAPYRRLPRDDILIGGSHVERVDARDDRRAARPVAHPEVVGRTGVGVAAEPTILDVVIRVGVHDDTIGVSDLEVQVVNALPVVQVGVAVFPGDVGVAGTGLEDERAVEAGRALRRLDDLHNRGLGRDRAR